MAEIHERLVIARESAGFETAADAARALGVKLPTYYSHENGTGGLRRVVLEKYARKFKVDYTWLSTGRGEMHVDGAIPFESEIVGLPLLGSIQAGHWVEIVPGVDEGAEKEMVPVVRDPRFPNASQYALKVVGDSMDLEYPDGSIVTCVSFAETGLELADGMIVHVERQRAGGHLIETTLKLVEVRRGGGFVLAPRSSNKKWTPITLNGSDGETEVVAKGLVLGGYSPRVIPNFSR